MIRLLKIGGILVVVVAMLLGIVAIALNSSAVQNRLMKHAAKLLSEMLKTEVTIGSVHVDILGQKVNLNNLEVEDLQHRKMLQMESLAVDIDLLALRHHEVIISEAKMSGLRLLLLKENPDSAANYQFVIDAFKKDTLQTKADSTGQSEERLKLDLKRLTLERISTTYNSNEFGVDRLTFQQKEEGGEVTADSLRFKTDNHKPHKRTGKPHRGYFDGGHIDAVANARLIIHHVDKDSLSATVTSCDATDRGSGLTVKDLRLKVDANKQTAHLSDVTIGLQNTVLNFAEADVELPDKKSGRSLSYSTSAISGKAVLQDIARPFAPVLGKFTMPLNLSVLMSGTDDTMKFRNVKVSTADKKLTIAATGNIENLKDKYKLAIHFDVGNMQTRGDEVLRIIQQLPLKKFMTKQLSALGKIGYKGSFDILWRKEVFRGNLHTDPGSLNFHFSLDENGKYVFGTASTNSLQLGMLFDIEAIGEIACTANFKFDISKQRTAKMRRQKGGKLPIGHVDATVAEASYKKVKVKNLLTVIESDGAIAEGSVMNKGKYVDVSCDFSFTNTDSFRKMKVKPHLRLHKLTDEYKKAKEERKLKKQQERKK